MVIKNDFFKTKQLSYSSLQQKVPAVVKYIKYSQRTPMEVLYDTIRIIIRAYIFHLYVRSHKYITNTAYIYG